MIYKFRLGDEGTIITLNFARETSPGVFSNVDVSLATIRTARLEPPSGTAKTKSCTAGAATNQTQFTLATADFDEVGTWRIRGYVEGPTFKWTSREVEVQVEAID
jgi:hypothetical protein